MSNQSYRFIIVGVLNTFVGLAVYAVYLHIVNNNYLQALMISHIIGVIHSYFWNNKWTFQQGRYNIKSSLKFVLVYIVTFLINFFLLKILVDTIGMNKLIAQVIALFLTTVVSFFGHKYWSFRSSKNS